MSNTNTSRLEVSPPASSEVHLTFKDPPQGGIWDQIFATFVGPECITLIEHKGDNGSGSRREWKDWTHYKCASSIPSSQSCVVATDSYSWNPGWDHYGFMDCGVPGCFYNYTYGAPGQLNSGLTPFYDPLYPGGVHPPEGIGGLLDRAWKAMIPRIKPELSLVNSVIELKDFKTVGRSLKNARDLLVLPGLTLRQKLRKWSDVYLQKKFNVDPLISDIKAIYASMSKCERRINGLISRQGRKQNAHFTCALAEGSNSYETGSEYPLSNPNGWYCSKILRGTSNSERFVNYAPSVFHAEIQFSYYYADYQTEHARLLSLLDALGVNFNPAIVWNALPWSFVVDWLAGVSRWLGDNHIGFMDPAVCIHRALWSIKRSRTILVQTKVRTPSNYGLETPPQTITLPMVTETAYRRSLCSIRDVAPSLTTSGLSLTELSLASALVLSRRGRTRRGRK